MSTEALGPDEGASEMPAHDPRDDLPWWNIESPIRRRIKGRYLNRASFVVALMILAMPLAPYAAG